MASYNPMERGTISVQDMGVTTAPMRDQLEELKAKIRMGVSKVELGFWGAGKGSAQNPTPGTYGKHERQAMKELAKVNDIELTTHATPMGIAPLSGIDMQRGGYSDQARKDAIDEIKRSIDFASEVTNGGAVVMHAGEFQRPIIEAGLDNGEKIKVRDKDFKPKFREHEAAKEKAWFSVVDTRSGQIQQGFIDTTQTFREPVMDNDGKVLVYTETDKDVNGRILEDSGEEHFVGDPKLRAYTWMHVIKETKEHNELARQGKPDPQFKEYGPKYSKIEMSPTEYFQVKQVRNKVLASRGQRAYYQQILDQTNEILKADDAGGSSKLGRKLTLEERRHQEELQNHYLEGIAQMRGQEAELKEQIDRMEDVEKYALEKTAESLATLGMYTMERQEAEEKASGEKFKNDLFIAPENVYPEQYGGHPEELIKIIKEGRAAMADKLMDRGLSERQANNEASNHIKATFDIAHANLWKRYFTGKEEDYWEWYSEQVKKLQDEGVLGHIHVNDNFGYADEHVAPGQGNLPIKELVEKFKKSDVDFVVEPGWKGDQNVIESFKEFGSPIYGLSRPDSSDPWNVIDTSYFGRTAPPYFVVGGYAQQMGEQVGKDFSAWTGMPFE